MYSKEKLSRIKTRNTITAFILVVYVCTIKIRSALNDRIKAKRVIHLLAPMRAACLYAARLTILKTSKKLALPMIAISVKQTYISFFAFCHVSSFRFRATVRQALIWKIEIRCNTSETGAIPSCESVRNLDISRWDHWKYPMYFQQNIRDKFQNRRYNSSKKV